MGAHEEALAVYNNINLDSISRDSVSPRLLQLLAEAYAIKGICRKEAVTAPNIFLKYIQTS